MLRLLPLLFACLSTCLSSSSSSSSSSSASSHGDPFDPNTDLIRWVVQYGGAIDGVAPGHIPASSPASSSSPLCPPRSASPRRGMVARAALAVDDHLLSVPVALVQTAASVMASSPLAPFLARLNRPLSDVDTLSVHLMYELFRGTASPIAPYLRSLPARGAPFGLAFTSEDEGAIARLKCVPAAAGEGAHPYQKQQQQHPPPHSYQQNQQQHHPPHPQHQHQYQQYHRRHQQQQHNHHHSNDHGRQEVSRPSLLCAPAAEERRIALERRKLRAAYDHLNATLFAMWPERFPSVDLRQGGFRKEGPLNHFSFSQFLWARSMVASRSFTVMEATRRRGKRGESSPALVPLADMFNHHGRRYAAHTQFCVQSSTDQSPGDGEDDGNGNENENDEVDDE